MLTEYGYETDCELQPIATLSDVDAAAVSRVSDEAMESALDAAHAVIRNHCGWHVAPSMACVFETECGGFPEIQLPATFVSSVDSVKVDGHSVEFRYKHNGRVVRKDGRPWPCEWGSVVIEYTAGVDAAQLRHLVCKMAAADAESPAAVRSESIGSASATYKDTDGLTERQMAVLSQYRLKARP